MPAGKVTEELHALVVQLGAVNPSGCGKGSGLGAPCYCKRSHFGGPCGMGGSGSMRRGRGGPCGKSRDTGIVVCTVMQGWGA